MFCVENMGLEPIGLRSCKDHALTLSIPLERCLIMIRNCNICEKPYQAEQRYLNRGQGLTCSRTCGTILASQKKVVKHEPNVVCAYCQTPFYKRESRLDKSKSGLFFCCREHKDLSQRLGGIQEIMPSHYGTARTPSYRKKAFALLPNLCARCGWDLYPDVLEVNHIDKDRTNNSIDNLEILCPTCHQVFHFLDKSGRWAGC